ncbi:phosphate/phosphite/phosphonate ABC transporter substrate-binding protein [Thiomicrorhabdus sp. Milos-T2]|uniref:substrate-binding domain-containing protein n=1 Tax=Thiomicrorhabdus sp. Milos-T2 TaxID=90814 RepID=UPI000A0042A4|nr:phosphate/phosphite/phosphonate ABC transporter substrate-binding protein [Thiomicrorhabdus sp. Milos-T2]
MPNIKLNLFNKLDKTMFYNSNVRTATELPISNIFSKWIWITLCFFMISSTTFAQTSPLRFAITPVFMNSQAKFLQEWQSYLSQKLGTPVTFIQRNSYSEITALLENNQADVAWVCGYPYIQHKKSLTLISSPLFKGAPLYQSYLIVPKADKITHSIFDLRHKLIAYSDTHSNSGNLYPKYLLWLWGESPDHFFKKMILTNSHENSIKAVAVGLVNGAFVDGYVWESLQKIQPKITQQTRIVLKSPEFGFPPIVARSDLSPDIKKRFKHILLGMDKDVQGKILLNQLLLDGFQESSPNLYDSIQQMQSLVDGLVFK